jgi:hypothetical protein
MNATATKQATYLDPISLASVMQMLSGLNPYATLYSDSEYGIDSFGGSYYPKLEAKAFGREGMSFNSVLKEKPVTVGEFLNFLRDSIGSLENEGHTVNIDCEVWMAFEQAGISPVGGGVINGLCINGDGSYTLRRLVYSPSY